MWLFVIFMAIPIIEIGLFIKIGGAIGLWPTLLIVAATAILGTTLLRVQGRQALRNLQTSFGALQDPTAPLAHGALIVFGGALLLTPGFFTDAVGLSLMVPLVRNKVLDSLRAYMKPTNIVYGSAKHASVNDADIVDADFDEVAPKPTHQPGPSGWTKH